MSDIYVIESIRNRADGNPHEREARRKGHRVEILHCCVGDSLLFAYRDDGGKVLRTSAVSSVSHGDDDLVVWTRNTVYHFTKEAA